MGRPKRRTRMLIIVLFLFFLSILTVLFFQSSLSKVHTIHVSGTERLSAEKVIGESKIHIGDQILTISPKKIEGILLENPLIKKATLQISFPGKINILIEENRVIGYLLKDSSFFNVLLENGHALPIEENEIMNAPFITEWPTVETLPAFCKELASLEGSVYQHISEIRLTPTENDPFKLIVYTKEGFELRTSTLEFKEQIQYYPSIVEQLQEKEPGVIHLNDEGIFYISYQELEDNLTNELEPLPSNESELFSDRSNQTDSSHSDN